MARYRITENNAGRLTSEAIRCTRPAAHNYAYARWYAELSVTAGRDTQAGWNGVNALGNWLIRGAQFEHGDKVTVTRHDYTLTVVRER